MKKVVKISRVRLMDFIEALTRIYDDGAEYIDIVGMVEHRQDVILLEVKEEYVRKDVNLTDDLLNDLTNG